MELLENLINAITSFNIHKFDAPDMKVSRIDVYDYALCLINYLKDNEDKLDSEFLFSSKFVLGYLIQRPLVELYNESRELRKMCEERLEQIDTYLKELSFRSRVKTFDEFIEFLCLPQVETGKDAVEVISRQEFYKTSDDLYRMMRLAVVRPNDRLLRYYNRHYKGIKLEYIKMIANVVMEEYPQYDLEVDEADKQFIELCKMIKDNLKIDESSEYHKTASYYFSNSMNIILKKRREKSK